MGSRFCFFDVDLPLIIILSIAIITLSINSWVQQYANLTIFDIWEWGLTWWLKIFQNYFGRQHFALVTQLKAQYVLW